MTKLPVPEGIPFYVLRVGEDKVVVGADSGTLPRQLALNFLKLRIGTGPTRLRQGLLKRDPLADVVVVTRTDLGVGVCGGSGALDLPDFEVRKKARNKTMKVLQTKFDDENFYEPEV
jgi:hypothetical protein